MIKLQINSAPKPTAPSFPRLMQDKRDRQIVLALSEAGDYYQVLALNLPEPLRGYPTSSVVDAMKLYLEPFDGEVTLSNQ